jgi:stage II sporulation protein AA (anti-sigma F factor antagonist)
MFLLIKGVLMNLSYKVNNKVLTVYIKGELDECSAPKIKTDLDAILDENFFCDKVVFDLSGLTFMDSTGIGLLIGRYKKLKEINIPSFVTGASNSAEKVLEISGIYKIMPRY